MILIVWESPFRGFQHGSCRLHVVSSDATLKAKRDACPLLEREQRVKIPRVHSPPPRLVSRSSVVLKQLDPDRGSRQCAAQLRALLGIMTGTDVCQSKQCIRFGTHKQCVALAPNPNIGTLPTSQGGNRPFDRLEPTGRLCRILVLGA